MQLDEVRKMNDVNALMETYERAYKHRYGVMPPPQFRSNGIGILRGVMEHLGSGRVSALLEHYLRSSEKWFLDKGHSLPVFKDSVMKLHLSLGGAKPAAVGKMMIREFLCCDTCFKHFDCVHEIVPSYSDYFWRCPKCIEANPSITNEFPGLKPLHYEIPKDARPQMMPRSMPDLKVQHDGFTESINAATLRELIP